MSKWTNKTTQQVIVGCSFLRTFFTDKELLILQNIPLMETLSLSAGVRKLSSELNIPESTCKHILRKFRDANLINAGSTINKGASINLTPFGELLQRGRAAWSARRAHNFVRHPKVSGSKQTPFAFLRTKFEENPLPAIVEVAQLAERESHKLEVAGAVPALDTKFKNNQRGKLV